MTITINYKKTIKNNELSNQIIFIDEKLGIKSIKKFILTNEFSFVADLIKTKDPKRMDAVLNTIITQIKNISILLNPIIPIASNNVLDFLNIPTEKRKIAFIKDKNVFDYEKKLNKFNILFKKIENDN